jgi:hypothetical protein
MGDSEVRSRSWESNQRQIQHALKPVRGQTRRGTNEIRAWREHVASTYEYTTEVVGVEPAGEGQHVARVHLEGNFPGGTVDLRYRFSIDGDSIRRLEIAP